MVIEKVRGFTCSGSGPAALAGIECVDCSNLLGCKREVEDVDVLGNSLRADGFRNERSAQLDLPAQDNLCSSLSVVLREQNDRRM